MIVHQHTAGLVWQSWLQTQTLEAVILQPIENREKKKKKKITSISCTFAGVHKDRGQNDRNLKSLMINKQTSKKTNKMLYKFSFFTCSLAINSLFDHTEYKVI